MIPVEVLATASFVIPRSGGGGGVILVFSFTNLLDLTLDSDLIFNCKKVNRMCGMEIFACFQGLARIDCINYFKGDIKIARQQVVM